MDAIKLLTDDHRTVEGLFQRYEQPGADTETRRAVVDEIIRELSIHAVLEEQLLYPRLRDAVPGGEPMAEEALQEHQEAKEELARLDKTAADDPRFDGLVRSLISDVRHHVEEEETELFPGMTQAL